MTARRVAAVAMIAACLVAGPTATAFAQELSFERYVTTIEPIFLAARGGYGPGRAACASCHAKQGTQLKLQPLQEDESGDVFWTEAQSRHNFDVVSRLVTPGDPDHSRLLLKALAVPAGGAPFHVGGKFFFTRTDPEWRLMAAWVGAAAAKADSAVAPAPTLDFGFFEQCVQRVFLDKREGLMECVHCHDSGARGFAQTLPADRSFWNADESRENLALLGRYIEPGYPLQNRFLTHPLAPAAGGDHFHGGGRRWTSQDDPEWQMLAAWVRGEPTSCLGY